LNVVAFSMNIADAIAFPRLHNQLIPSETLAEVDYPPWILAELRARNHTIQFKNPLSAVQGIVVGDDGLLYGASDWRKLGLPAGY
jgi:gamma-glutamyltranspeptidase